MKEALIGYSGFVGGNLQAQHSFNHLYRSTNIAEIENQSFDLLVCSGLPAEKWKINQNPEADWANIEKLMGLLKTVKAQTAILISTIDVYPKPFDVYEDTEADFANNHPYGKHHYLFERFFAQQFPNAYNFRLPGLFGNGLKKNVIYDFLHNNNVDKINGDGVFQFYNLDYLWSDIQKALSANIRLLNVSTEPVSVKEVAKECFGFDFDQAFPNAPSYAMKSRHAALWNGEDGYLYSKKQVLDDIRNYVQKVKATL